jgi:hypothetical protein
VNEIKGMPGYVYEIDKLGNKVMYKAEKKKEKAMGKYNKQLSSENAQPAPVVLGPTADGAFIELINYLN